MDARMLVAALNCRGITLRVEGDRLIATPAASVTSEDADRIRRHKTALINALTTLPARRRPVQECVTCGDGLPPQSWARCPGCVNAAYQRRDQRRQEGA